MKRYVTLVPVRRAVSACSTVRTPLTPGDGSVLMPSSEKVTATPVTVSKAFSTASSEPGGIANVRDCVCGGVCGPAALSCHEKTGRVSLGVQTLTWASAAAIRSGSSVMRRSTGSAA